jgi:hypothetical protein
MNLYSKLWVEIRCPLHAISTCETYQETGSCRFVIGWLRCRRSGSSGGGVRVASLGRGVLLCRVSRRPGVLWPFMGDVGAEAVGSGVAPARDAVSLLKDVSEARTMCGASEEEELEAQRCARATLPLLCAELARQESTEAAASEQEGEAHQAKPSRAGAAHAGGAAMKTAGRLLRRLRHSWFGRSGSSSSSSPDRPAERRLLAEAQAVASVAVGRMGPGASRLLAQYALLAECAARWEAAAVRQRAGWTGVAGRAIASVSKWARK